MNEITERFRNRISETGLLPPDRIIPGGVIYRFRSSPDSNNPNGWYWLHQNEVSVGAFGCWKRDFKEYWFSKNLDELTPAKRNETLELLKKAELKRKKEEEERQLEKSREASSIWDESRKASSEHSYLKRKKISADGLRQDGERLVAKLVDCQGRIQSLQFIDKEGTKRFLPGGKTNGYFFPYGPEQDEKVYIAEGLATAATIFSLTGVRTLATFSAGNLKPVSIDIRKNFPNVKIVICADDDWMTAVNPGISKAIEAAREVSGMIVIPEFKSDRKKEDTDFNDLLCRSGEEISLDCLKNEQSPGESEIFISVRRVREKLEEVRAGDGGAHLEPEILKEWRFIHKKRLPQFERLRSELKAIPGVRIGALDQALRREEGDEDHEGEDVVENLVDIVNRNAELFHDSSKECFARFEQDEHQENWNLESKGFKEWLSYQFFNLNRRSPSEQSIKAAISTLSGMAKYEGQEREVSLRISKESDSYWIDICDEAWRSVKISPDLWEIQDRTQIPFIRNQNMKSLPSISKKGDIDPLWSLVNIPDEERNLLLCWILECFRPDTPFVLLEIIGEQGSAKSFSQEILKNLVDPNTVNLRAKPKDREALFVSAENSHLISIENLSHLAPDIQDAFCTFCTGGGFADRTLYTNKEETIIEVKRPVVINGINTLVTRQDLLDRTLHIELNRITTRRTNDELVKAFAANKEIIWTGLMDLFSAALGYLNEVEIEKHRIPRMADFAFLGEAVYRALGFEKGSFLDDYERNRLEGVYRTIDASPVATKLKEFIDSSTNGQYSGPIGNLFNILSDYNQNEDGWPKSPKGFGSVLRRIAPAFRTLGYKIEIDSKRKMDGYHCEIINLNNIHVDSESIEDFEDYRTNDVDYVEY